MQIKITLILFLSVLLGCSDWTEKKTDKSSKVERNEAVKKRKEIFGNEFVEDELFVSHVNAGDILYFKIKGVEIKNSFTDIYKKTAPSSWEYWRCETMCRECEDDCGWETLRGNCDLYYRDFKGTIERPIKFTDDTKTDQLKIRVKIEETYHPFINIFFVEDNVIHLAFLVLEGMVKDGHDLSLVVQNKPETLREGFQDFGKCHGRGGKRRKNFSVEANLTHHLMDVHEKKEYEVSVDILRNE